MPKGGKNKDPATPAHVNGLGSGSSSGSNVSPQSQQDGASLETAAILNVMTRMVAEMEQRQRADEQRRIEERERDEQRRIEEREREDERFRMLLETLQVRPRASTTEQVSPPGTSRSSVARTLPSQPPPALSLDTSVGAFRRWRSQWYDYATLIHLDEFSATEQSAILRRALSQDVQDVMDEMQTEPLREGENLTVDRQIDDLEKYFQEKRDLGREREAFERRVQEPGELFDHFYIALRNLGKDADLCDNCFDQRIADRIRVGLHDDDIRRRLMAIRPYPGLEEVVAFCRREEAGRKFCSRNPSVNRVGRSPSRDRSSRPSRSVFHTEGRHQGHSRPGSRDGQNATKCKRCGKQPHKVGQLCPALSSTCRFCQRRGHFAKVCFQR